MANSARENEPTETKRFAFLFIFAFKCQPQMESINK